MERRSTKDHYERETDEAERLVRPSPKVKPPRRDLRREDMKSDKDPDLDQKDPDLSMNYKNIGGSVGARVVARWLSRTAEDRKDLVKVRHRETGHTTYVTPETLKEKGGEYEVVQPDEDDKELKSPEGPSAPEGPKPPEEAPVPESKPPEEKGHSREQEAKQLQSYRALHDAIEDDPGLKSLANGIADPKVTLGQLPNDFPMEKLKAIVDKFPALRSYKTIGEARSAFNGVKNLKKLQDRFNQKWKATPEGKPSKEEKAPEGPKLDPEKQQALSEAGAQIREMAQKDPVLQTVVHQLDGQDSKALLNLRHQLNPAEDISSVVPGLPPEVKTLGDMVEAIKSTKPGEEKKAPKEPESEEPKEDTGESSKKLIETLQKALGITPKEDKPKGKLHPDEQGAVDKFLADKEYEKPEFKQWADQDSSTIEGDNGEPLFVDEDRHKHVPFNKLPPEAQHEWVERYQKQGKLQQNAQELKDRSFHDQHLANALKDLANPHSELFQEVSGSGGMYDLQNVRKSVPALRALNLPKGIKSVGDLIEAAREIHGHPVGVDRRPTSPEEEDRAKRQIIENFPVEVAEKLLHSETPVHPDDVRELVENYNAARLHADDDEILDLVKKGEYQTDPDKVRPPSVGVNGSGQEVPFDELSDEEKTLAVQKHRMFVMAMSLAARERAVEKLKKKTKAPEELLGSIADFTLQSNPGENPDEREARAAQAAKQIFADTVKRGLMEGDTDRYSRWQAKREKLIQQHEEQAREQGEEYDPDKDTRLPPAPTPKEMSEGQLRKILEHFKDDPAAQHLAVGYAQAGDYLHAKQEFLSPDSPKSITEHGTPNDIVRGLRRMGEFFDDASKKYPEDMRDLVPAKDSLRNQVVDKIRNLSPEKFPFVKNMVQEDEFDDYESRLKRWEKDYAKYQKQLAKYEGKGDPYRSKNPAPAMPSPPRRPVGYLQARGKPEELESRKKSLLDKFRRSVGVQDADKTASLLWRVVDRSHSNKYSSCIARRTMGVSLASRVAQRAKNSVYWGVAPYPKGHEGFAPYQEWQQVHQRDYSEKDFSSILKAAREWLKAPVLSSAVDGIYRDTQLRAALDLAIRSCEDGKYSVGMLPPLYNMLLARLGGAPEGGTQLTDMSNINGPVTVVTGSLYHSAGDTSPMKPSQQLRAFAARVANTDPGLAYDLLDLSSKLAQDEQAPAQDQQSQKQGGEVPPQFLEHMKKKEEGGDKADKEQGQGQQKDAAYKTLRSAVIRMAHANPQIRDAYLPLLETIKKLG